MYKDLIEQDLKRVIIQLGFKPTDTLLSISQNSKFGEYSTNVALQLAKLEGGKTYQSPVEIANEILQKFGHPSYLEQIEIAGPGFINFSLKDEALEEVLDQPVETKTSDRRVLVEYADLNTHKPFHIGHLRTLVYGESVARLLEYQGVEVLRANYGSDIGPTVAKCLWGIERLKEKYEEVKKNGSLKGKAEFLGEAYAYAYARYEEDPIIKEQIDEITKKIYQRDPLLVPLWEETKLWSLGYFDLIYSRMGVEFDLRINESEVDELGKKIVLENKGTIFEEDDGAIIFRGQNYGLHTRVFITKVGNPTYEGKEIGLIEKYQEVFPFDEVLILSDVQQDGFFQVVNRAIELINPKMKGKKKHLSYGVLSLTTGRMASRKGNVITAESLIDIVKDILKETYSTIDQKINDQTLEKIAIAAIKFYYLKYSVASDMIYDVEKSVSIQGDTGPYLLYTYTRTASILAKMAKDFDFKNVKNYNLNPEEKEVLRQIEFFDFKATESAKNLSPSELTTYLLDLAKSFNLFYEKHSVLASESVDFRLKLTKKVGETLKSGLYLLGIETVERM